MFQIFRVITNIMADQAIINLFHGLGQEIGGLSSVIKTQGVFQDISPFFGDQKFYKSWIKSIDKHATLNNLDEDHIKKVAYQTSRDAVSDFLERYLAEHQDASWNQVKAELSARFSAISDKQHAFLLLHQIRQKKDENVPVYAERVYNLAVQAYDDMTPQEIQRQLVSFFENGLRDHIVRTKVLRENPPTFQRAVEIAMNEHNFQRRVELRTHNSLNMDSNNIEQPMEIDYYRPRYRYNQRSVEAVQSSLIDASKTKCFNCGKLGHVRKDCRAPQSNRTTQFRIQCFHCGKFGHIARHCRARKQNSGN